MDAAMQEERQALGRIAALLVALAVLAERAAEKPVALRCFVIWLLSRAEIAAQGFVDGMFWRRDPTTLPLQAAAGGTAEAIRLAASLRALAGALDRAAGQTRSPACLGPIRTVGSAGMTILSGRRRTIAMPGAGREDRCRESRVSFHRRGLNLGQGRIATSMPTLFPPFRRQRFRPSVVSGQTRAPPPSIRFIGLAQ